MKENKKYECENHKINICCLGCVKAHINAKNKLLEFVKSLTKKSCCNSCECISCDAIELLREIGEK